VQHLRSLIYTAMLFLTTAFYAVVVILLMWLPPARLYAIPRVWARTNLWLLKTICNLDYRVEGTEHLPSRPFISMWKHSSTWETIAQMILVPRAAWLLKREILWIPVLGWAVARFHPIAIDRKAGGSAVNQVVTQGKQRLAEGLGVVIYPEGTRVAPGETRKFGMSGALLASQSGAPLVPIAHDSGYYWRRRGLLKRPGVIHVVIGPPIETDGLEPREITERTKAWIDAKVAELAERQSNGA
jgi:1-acyl-sn-glycerol-3-phosphate acyltransferase